MSLISFYTRRKHQKTFGFIYLFIYLFINLFIYLFIYLLFSDLFCLFIYVFIYLYRECGMRLVTENGLNRR